MKLFNYMQRKQFFNKTYMQENILTSFTLMPNIHYTICVLDIRYMCTHSIYELHKKVKDI